MVHGNNLLEVQREIKTQEQKSPTSQDVAAVVNATHPQCDELLEHWEDGVMASMMQMERRCGPFC